MFEFLKRKVQVAVKEAPAEILPAPLMKDNFILPKTGKELLADPKREIMMTQLWKITPLNKENFENLVRQPLERYAEVVQLLPASENHHHAYLGGMLDHGIEVAIHAVNLSKQHMLPPNATPEVQAVEEKKWRMGIFYAALLHDVAKVIVDLEPVLADGRRWPLWKELIKEPYRIRYFKDRDYHLHASMNLVLCHRILGDTAMSWMLSSMALFRVFGYALSGHYEKAGIIGEVVLQADRASVANAMGGDPVKAINAMKSPVHSLQKKLAEGLRYIVTHRFKLNDIGAQGFLTNEALWIMAGSANDLRAYLLELGIDSVPNDNSKLYDEMQSYSLIEATPAGKAVWECQVVIGSWVQKFTLLKVSPALIWEGDRPALFEGKLTVLTPTEAEKTDQSVPATTPQTDEDELKPAIVVSNKPITAPVTSALDAELMGMMGVGPVAETTKQEVAPEIQSVVVEKPVTEPEKKPDKGANNSVVGQAFWDWLIDALANHKLTTNQATASVHTVNDGLFLISPKIFRRYCNEKYGQDDNEKWKDIQIAFQRLKIHSRTEGDENIFDVRVNSPNKKASVVKGYLIEKSFIDIHVADYNNPHLELIDRIKVEESS